MSLDGQVSVQELLLWALGGTIALLVLILVTIVLFEPVWRRWLGNKRWRKKAAIWIEKAGWPATRSMAATVAFVVVLAYFLLRVIDIFAADPGWGGRHIQAVLGFVQAPYGFILDALAALLGYRAIKTRVEAKPVKPLPQIEFSTLAWLLRSPVKTAHQAPYRENDRSHPIVFVPHGKASLKLAPDPVTTVSMGLEEGRRYDIVNIHDTFQALERTYKLQFKYVLVLAKRDAAAAAARPQEQSGSDAGRFDPPDIPVAAIPVERFRMLFQEHDYLDLRALAEAIQRGGRKVLEMHGFVTHHFKHSTLVFDAARSMIECCKCEAMITQDGNFAGILQLCDLYNQLLASPLVCEPGSAGCS